MLEPLGLTPAAEQLYQKLLQEPDKPLGEIGKDLVLTSDALQTALDLLLELEIVEARDKPSVVVPPEVITTKLLFKQESEIAELQHRHELSQQAAKSFLTEHSLANQQGSNRSELVFGMNDIRQRIAELAAATNRTVRNFVVGGAQASSALKASQEPTLEMLNRGIESQSIYFSSTLQSKVMLTHFEFLTTHGTLVRTTPYLPVRMIIYDDEVAVLPFNMKDALASITVERSKGVLKALVDLFDKYWNDATPFGEPEPQCELDKTSTAVLRRLATGRDAGQVGEDLGLSTKSVYRIIDELEANLGANSRFTLGAAAAKAGWI